MSIHHIEPSNRPHKLLQLAIKSNAIFSGLSGGVFIMANRPLTAFTGIPWSGAFAGIGVTLLIYALILLYIGYNVELSVKFGRFAVALDGLWVAGTIILLVSGWLPLTTAGVWTLIILGDIVLGFALWQGYALWKLQ